MLVLSHSIWKNQFASDPNILGKTIVLSGAPWTVIGVMPSSFSFIRNHDLWVPMELTADRLEGHNSILVVGRLRKGVGAEQANAEMQILQAQIARELPEVGASGNSSARVMPLRNFLLGRNARQMLAVWLGAVGFVLLIACANIANLLLARGAARQKEISVRISLGASRTRIVGQLLVETLVLAIIGAGFGLLLTSSAVGYLSTLRILQAPGAPPVAIDYAVLAFVAGVTCVAALVAGLVPAWQSSKTELIESIKATSSATVGVARHHRLRSALVVADVALSVVLLAGAGLLVRSFVNLLHVNPGFKPAGLLTMDVSLSRYSTPEAARNFYEQALDRVRALPGVERADLCTTLPLIGWNYGIAFRTADQPKEALERQHANLQVVTEGYFETLSLPVIRGRAFSAQDKASSLPVVIINQHFAERLFKGDDPIGKRVLVARSPFDATEIPRQIVGVAANVKDESLLDPASDDIYLPYPQAAVRYEYMVVRSSGDPAALTSSIRAAIASVDKDQPIEDVATMQQRLDESLSGQQFAAGLLAGFALLALLLAAIGIYGVIAYTTAQRTAEFGLRMALGAQPASLLRLVLRAGMKLALLGCLLGIAGALAITRVMGSVVFGVSTRDPLAFAAAVALLAATATLATFIPARRVTKVDPMVALRYE